MFLRSKHATMNGSTFGLRRFGNDWHPKPKITGKILHSTQATVGGSPFGLFISVARGHSRE